MGTTTMRAAVFPAAETMVVEEFPVPEPGPDEALLRILLCGICGSDVSVWRGGALAGPGVVLGHEVAAEVVEDRTGTLEPGTRVTVFPPRGCGECLWCRRGQPRHCLNPPARRQGGFAEYAVYPAASLIRIPEGLDPRLAALADPLGVATRAVPMAAARPGDVAYVGGLGAIGLMTVSVLADAGCTVVGGDPLADRRELALRFGAAAAVDPIREDPFEAASAFDPAGPRLAFECSGHPDGLQEIFDACAPLGTVGILGIPKSPTLLLRMTTREQTAFSIAGPTIEAMGAAVAHLAAHPELDAMVTGVVGLGDLGPTIERLRRGEGGIKVLIDPER
jgi:L-iditol 2-dehydrogenase